MGFETRSGETQTQGKAIVQPVKGSGRYALIPTLLTQSFLANFHEHIQNYAKTIAEASKLMSGTLPDIDVLIELSILKNARTLYADIISTSPIMPSAANLATLLDSTDPMWTVETHEDFGYVNAVHLPELIKIQQDINQQKASVKLLDNLRFIPSFRGNELASELKSHLLTRTGIKKEAREKLFPKATDSQVEVISMILKGVVSDVTGDSSYTRIFSFWEILTRIDERLIQSGANAFSACSSSIHHMMNQSAYPILPISGEFNKPMVRVATDLANHIAERNPSSVMGIQSKEIIEDLVTSIDEFSPVQLDSVVELISHVIYLSVVDDVHLSIGDITLPISIHAYYPIIQTMFAESTSVFVADTNSSFFELMKEYAKMGARTPLKVDDVEHKIENAIIKDKNNIPAAFIKEVESKLTNVADQLFSKYQQSKHVYKPHIHAPLDRTNFRCQEDANSIIKDGAISIKSDLPFIEDKYYTVGKPVGSEEVFVLKNAIDQGIAIEGSLSQDIMPYLNDLFLYRDPTATSMRKKFDLETVFANATADFGMHYSPDFSHGKQQLKLSEIIQNGSFSYKDEVTLFEERTLSDFITLPKTLVRLEKIEVRHQYLTDAAMYGIVKGTLAGTLLTNWAKLISDIAVTIGRTYSSMSFGPVVKEVSVSYDYNVQTYIKRRMKFDTWFAETKFVHNPNMWRFLSSFHVQHALRDKLDFGIIDKLHKYDLYMNTAMRADARRYANAIVTSIKENFSNNSRAFKIFTSFVNGEMTEQDMAQLREPGSVAVFSTLVDMIFGKAKAEGTLLTLAILDSVLEQFKS